MMIVLQKMNFQKHHFWKRRKNPWVCCLLKLPWNTFWGESERPYITFHMAESRKLDENQQIGTKKDKSTRDLTTNLRRWQNRSQQSSFDAIGSL